MSRVTQSFYAHSARTVAQALLGKKLVRQLNGRLLSGIIVETEAYCDGEARDLACHGERVNDAQPTPRTAVMFGPAGFAYVYFTYGIHWMFNVVTGQAGQPNAVLVRALEPVDGIALMIEHRGERPLCLARLVLLMSTLHMVSIGCLTSLPARRDGLTPCWYAL